MVGLLPSKVVAIADLVQIIAVDGAVKAMLSFMG